LTAHASLAIERETLAIRLARLSRASPNSVNLGHPTERETLAPLSHAGKSRASKNLEIAGAKAVPRFRAAWFLSRP
jgi:hypothetical protein